ncbi:MAG: GtrA family protein [Tannerella sp.]|nr:GtrA family protein [Tannerella sp.]
MILYGIIGSISAGLDSLIFYLLRGLHWNLYVVNFISINTGITCSFFLNAYFNFRITDRISVRAIKFFIIGYCGLSLSMLIIFFGVEIMNYHDMTIKIISIFIVAAFQFILNKYITFRRKANG